MRRLPWIALLLLSACANTWPSGSYVAPGMSDTDVKMVAPLIADYLSAALPTGSEISLDATPTDPVGMVLGPLLEKAGFTLGPTGEHVSYVADSGLLRVTIDDREGASRALIRNNGILSPAGPLTVFRP